MNEESDETWLEDMPALLAHLEVETLEHAGNIVSEETDPDAYLVDEDGEIVLRMDDQGVTVAFPLTVDDFWDMVRDLEDDVTATIEAAEGETP